ncbi:MAG: 4Fe-4S dicluster domain-containing protein [Bacillota bacterium]|nr:4Fe-4S dicluster domain-containing protein [Eubacteriales bacterium]MDD4285784.1 4Fe-4S dicluster domain-containing protein [Eubacteriales bacterium]MDI9491671.1 4Fe-4S dicluster domain-containing protein [Bacillota bacterium]NLV70633.1 4Fe-4S dicluster domain-containing protein [Clostridiales bacterium]
MGRMGFYFNMNTCLGCGACQVACKDKNGLQPGEFFRRVDTVVLMDHGVPTYHHYSGACNHCENPICVDTCTTGAMHKAPDGTVVHDDGICIGCGTCLWNCPYGSISFSKVNGMGQKCDACADLRAEGKEPACVTACPTHSLQFGDLDELQREFGTTLNAISILPDADLTKPSLTIKLPKSTTQGGNAHE